MQINFVIFIFCRAAFIAFLFVTSIDISRASDADCDDLKSVYGDVVAKKKGDRRGQFVESLASAVRDDRLCAKNLYGRALVEGVVFEKNLMKAYSVFMDLSDRGYPPAMYNVAFISMEERLNSPEVIFSILHGLIIKYSGDDEWGFLAADARELGWDFLAKIELEGHRDFRGLQEKHREVSSLGVVQTAQLMARLKARADEVSRVFASVLFLGAMVHGSASVGGYSAQPVVPIAPYQPQYYTVHSYGPNYLYVIPH